MTIFLNGERREVGGVTTVAKLLEELGLRPELLAVERNRDIVAREAYGETVLQEGDAIEIVTFVGGG